ncbi:hypothetical protein F5Y12DRAFT_634173 [Xylaria sp. FL1777]|nr:hypothetical protein F5Y12DRAFT_634173 [Xylaria sp. FL1777]
MSEPSTVLQWMGWLFYLPFWGCTEGGRGLRPITVKRTPVIQSPTGGLKLLAVTAYTYLPLRDPNQNSPSLRTALDTASCPYNYNKSSKSSHL